jgi:hypothetical protein
LKASEASSPHGIYGRHATLDHPAAAHAWQSRWHNASKRRSSVVVGRFATVAYRDSMKSAMALQARRKKA